MRGAAAPDILGRGGSAPSSSTRPICSLRSPTCRSTRCARLVERARDWRWSSTRAHLSGRDDGITALTPVRARIADFADFLAGPSDALAFARLPTAETIGRPLGEERFMARIERLTKRRLRPVKRGPKPKAE
jgi:putative transposase